jgi:hypothetical protein
MYLRHVGRDPRVDVDLATYDIGPQMAGRAVLFQLEAESRQFAVWHQDQIVKRLPIKGLVGQEMALDDYLKYIQQEALAAPRRSSARSSRKVRQPSRMASKEPDFFLHGQTFSVACLVLMQVRGACSLLAGQRHREQEEICCVDNPRI